MLPIPKPDKEATEREKNINFLDDIDAKILNKVLAEMK